MVHYLFDLIPSRCVRNARGREGRDYVWPSVTRRYGEVLSVNIYTPNTVGARYRSAECLVFGAFNPSSAGYRRRKELLVNVNISVWKWKLSLYNDPCMEH